MIYSQDMPSAIGGLSLQHDSDTLVKTPAVPVSMKRRRSEEELPSCEHKQRRRTTSSDDEGKH